VRLLSERMYMANCSRCGKDIGKAEACPHCGAGPSRSIVGRGTKKVISTTGEAIELGVKTTETVVREAKPLVKSAVNLGRKGVSKAKKETLGVAKKLKDEGE
jgi:primosomal protein N'